MKKWIAMLLALCLVFSLGACSKEEPKLDPNLGTYHVAYMEVEGTYLEASDDWLTLEAEGKGSTYLWGDTFAFEWYAEGEDLTILQMGDEFKGTLKDGVLIVDFADVICTFAKEGAEVPEKQPVPTEPKDPVVGWYALDSVSAEGQLQTREQLELAGLDKGYIVFYEDGSGFVRMPYEKDVPFVYQDGVAFDGNGEFYYAVEGDILSIMSGEIVMTFLRAEGEAPTFIGE